MNIYLASPYSHSEKQVEQSRFEKAQKATAALIKQGYSVFGPIAYSHPLATKYDLGLDFEYWQKFNRSWIDWADSIVVLCIDGWDKSKGIKGECEYAVLNKKPVYFLSFDSIINGKVKF